MTKNKPVYFAFDSDVIRTLAYIDLVKSKNKNIDLANSEDRLLCKYGEIFLKIHEFMRKDKIRVLILNNVYQENKHSQYIMNFIIDNCYVDNIDMQNYKQISSKVERLAYKYCKDYIDRDGSIKKAPMQAVFNALKRASIPSNDAFNMAESTLVGVNFVTANSKDYIFYKDPSYGDVRANGIREINRQEGYSYLSGTKIYSPKPISISQFGLLLHKIEKGQYVSFSDNKNRSSGAWELEDNFLSGEFDVDNEVE